MVRKSDKTIDLSIVLIFSLALTRQIYWSKKEISYYFSEDSVCRIIKIIFSRL